MMEHGKFWIFSCLVLNLLSVNCEKARYDNYRVYEILVENQEQLDLLKHIDDYPDGYRIIEFPGTIDKDAQIIVPPHKFGEFSEVLQKFQIKSRLMITNLQEVLDNEQPKLQRTSVLDWTRYWELLEIHNWLKQLVIAHPNDTELIKVGESYEGRDIIGIKFNIGKVSGKKQVIFEGTMHSREWISGATVTWMLNELITSEDPDIKELAATYEWIVIPVVNVDGYEFTWKSDRLWRKTRRPSNLLCFGADPNRNWDNFFNQGGSSMNPCSDLYAGAFPFSEPETKQYSDFVAALPNLSAYFSFHAFSQLLMLPYGYTHELLDNYDELYEIGLKALDSLKSRFGTEYRIGSIANIIYVASGSSLDWVKYNLHTNVTYAYELRDLGRYGFVLPASQIIDTSLETFDSIVTIMKESEKKGII
ncbi:zinc carboxypeptidase-like [Chironomus tepperi]|uniref:zinc carboxypeptidase-like n=1 Tax=Chironomus tepperi TaxID=113505 RepID=UPI00391FBD36